MTESRQSAANGQAPQTIFTTTRHQYTLKNGKQAEVCIQSFDPRESSSSSASAGSAISDFVSQSWILGLNGTIFLESGDNGILRPPAGTLAGLLIKRERIPQVEDEFLRRMMSVNSFTQQQAQQLFTSQGQLRDKFRQSGSCGSDNDSSWIFELCLIEVAPNHRRDGLGRTLVESATDKVLTWAQEAHRDVLMVLMLGAPKREMDEHKLIHPDSSATELQVVLSIVRRRAKCFWRSLGFCRLSSRSNWFGSFHPVASTEGHVIQNDEDWESEDEMVKFESHDDDMSPDVAKKLALYSRKLDT